MLHSTCDENIAPFYFPNFHLFVQHFSSLPLPSSFHLKQNVSSFFSYIQILKVVDSLFPHCNNVLAFHLTLLVLFTE